MKRTFLVIVLVFGILLIVAAAVFFFVEDGVTDISVRTGSADEIVLELKYLFPTGGYSVRQVPETEGENTGNGMTEYDGSLGKYRILVSFGDADLSESLMQQYPCGQVVEFSEFPVSVRIKRVHLNDHGFDLYIGFDSPISIESVSRGEMNPIGGKMQIPVTLQ